MDRHLIEKLSELSSGQHHVFSVNQADALGISYWTLRRAEEAGWIRRIRRGVYSLVGAPVSRWQGMHAAWLAAGEPAAISHSSAGSIGNVYGIAPSGPELITPADTPPVLAGVVVHRSKTLLPEDIVIRNGAAVTAPVRTIIDLAPRFAEPLLGKMLDEGAISRLWTARQVLDRLDRLPPNTAGRAKLARLLARRLGDARADTQLEQRVLRVVTPRFPGSSIHQQVVVDGQVFDMDIAWMDRMVDGEIDGLETRALSRSKFERMCRRENFLAGHGWRVIHLTHGMDDATLIAQLAPFFR